MARRLLFPVSVGHLHLVRGSSPVRTSWTALGPDVEADRGEPRRHGRDAAAESLLDIYIYISFFFFLLFFLPGGGRVGG